MKLLPVFVWIVGAAYVIFRLVHHPELLPFIDILFVCWVGGCTSVYAAQYLADRYMLGNEIE